jgi:dCTP deaminase
MTWAASKLIEWGSQGGIDPWDPSLVNPASLDLRVGHDARFYLEETGLVDAILERHRHPAGPVLLVATLERVRIPVTAAGVVRLKSSMARLGWRLAGAEWIDPGYEGSLTLCLSHGQPEALSLRPGQRFAQLILWNLSGEPGRGYSGRYQGSTGARGYVFS